jgi:hypothetical protein
MYWDGVDFGVDSEILVVNSIWGIPHRVYWDGVDFGVEFKILVVNSLHGYPPTGCTGTGWILGWIMKFWLSTLFMDIPPQDVLGRGGFWGGI